MAHKKGLGSSRNGRDSAAQRLGFAVDSVAKAVTTLVGDARCDVTHSAELDSAASMVQRSCDLVDEIRRRRGQPGCAPTRFSRGPGAARGVCEISDRLLNR